MKEHELANTKFEGDIAATVRSEYVARIDRATKEVLGLIPESDWNYTPYAATDFAVRMKHKF